MQFIKELFSVNEILTVSIIRVVPLQCSDCIIDFILLDKFQLIEADVGRRRYAQCPQH